MTPLLVAMFVTTVACDVGGQLFFKLGLRGFAGNDAHRLLGKFFAKVALSPWIWAGLLTYALEFVLWIMLLAKAPLSLLFPLSSLNYCGVVLVSQLLLGERVSWRRWAAVATITAGAAIVGSDVVG